MYPENGIYKYTGTITNNCSTMCGCIKGIDSSIISILQTLEIIEWAALAIAKFNAMPLPSLLWLFLCVLQPLLVVHYGSCWTRSVVSTSIKHSAAPLALSHLNHTPHSTIPVVHSHSTLTIVRVHVYTCIYMYVLYILVLHIHLLTWSYEHGYWGDSLNRAAHTRTCTSDNITTTWATLVTTHTHVLYNAHSYVHAYVYQQCIYMYMYMYTYIL